VAQFRYLGTTVTNKNSIQEEIERKLNSGKACYHSVQNILSSSLLSKNVKSGIHKTVISPAVLYGCDIWSLTLRDEHRLRVLENRVLRRIFEQKGTGGWRKLHNEELNCLYSSPDIIRSIKSRKLKRAGHVASMGKKRNAIVFWWESQKERHH
jgi:hypothetical protein